MVKLYTKTVCPKCVWVKSELSRTKVKVEVVNIDNDDSAREKLLAAGIRSVPTLEIGEELISDPQLIIEWATR